MTDDRSTLERELARLSPRQIPFDQLVRRRERRRRDERIRAGAVGLAVAIAVGWSWVHAVQSPSRPAGGSTTPPSGPHEFVRQSGEFLRSTFDGPGDLVAVDPATGQSRVIVERQYVPRTIDMAKWSPDGTSVAYDTGFGTELWVAESGRQPRRVAAHVRNWTWSPTGEQLSAVRGSTLIVVDAATGDTTDLAGLVGDVTSDPVWSPDGTRILFGARGGALYSVDVRSGSRSLLVQLPGDDLDSMDVIAWSPDGGQVAVMNDLDPGRGRLYLLDADGSNVRVLEEDYQPGGLAWSPDGSRLAYADDTSGSELRIGAVPADGTRPAVVATLSSGGCCVTGGDPVWSPDGSQIAFVMDSDHLRVDADGSGEATPMDEATYDRWRDDGSYVCGCFG